MTAQINVYNPAELGPPMGQYSHVTRVRASEFLFVAGMLAGNSKGEIVGNGDSMRKPCRYNPAVPVTPGDGLFS